MNAMAGRFEEMGEPGAASGHIAGPLVSVVTATYNASATLAACLASVRAQDYPHIEHILIDGASKDGTVGVLREHDSEIALWISEPDHGIYDAWNKGLRLARGEWIAFVGADDVLLPGAISGYMQLAAQHPEAQYLSGHVRWIGPGGKQEIIGEPWRWPHFLRFMCTAHVGSMHRRSLFEQYGEYDIAYRIVGDYELLLRARGNLRTAFMSRVTAQMQCGGASDSMAALDEAARAQRETGGRPAASVIADRWWAKAKFFGRRRFVAWRLLH
jgi:glycosyltransferase involved in cell wall biosynthesis